VLCSFVAVSTAPDSKSPRSYTSFYIPQVTLLLLNHQSSSQVHHPPTNLTHYYLSTPPNS